MRASAAAGFSTATDLADWLVREADIPFRDAHHITGHAVALCEQKGCGLDGLTIEDLKLLDPRLDSRVHKVLSVEASVRSRKSYGGTAPDNVRAQIGALEKAFGLMGRTVFYGILFADRPRPRQAQERAAQWRRRSHSARTASGTISAGARQRLVDLVDQRVEGEGLGDDVVDQRVEAVGPFLLVGESGHQQDLEAGILHGGVEGEGDAVHDRHADVGQAAGRIRRRLPASASAASPPSDASVTW